MITEYFKPSLLILSLHMLHYNTIVCMYKVYLFSLLIYPFTLVCIICQTLYQADQEWENVALVRLEGKKVSNIHAYSHCYLQRMLNSNTEKRVHYIGKHLELHRFLIVFIVTYFYIQHAKFKIGCLFGIQLPHIANSIYLKYYE